MHTFSAADHTQITGRVLKPGHIAVASWPRGDGSGYVLAVRPDGAQYAVWTYYAGEDNSVCVTWGHYFDAADYRHADRFGYGHAGAYAAAAAYFAEITATPAG